MYDARPLAETTQVKVKEYLKTAHQPVEDTQVVDLRYQIMGPWLMKLYVEGNKELYLEHMNTFKLDVLGRLGCGIWCFDPGGTRFYERKPQVHPDRPLSDKLEIAKGMKEKLGLQILQAHYVSADWADKYGIKGEVDENTIKDYIKCEKEGGPALRHLGGFTFYPHHFEFGGMTNPLKKIRKMAQENTIGMLKMCKKYNLEGAIWWPGGDGFRNQFGIPHVAILDYTAAVVAEALDEVPGVPLLLETKPYEPAMNNHIPTTMEGLIFAQNVESRLKEPTNLKLLEMGIPLVQFQPEVGHERMAYQKISKVWSQTAGRLATSHENDQPEGNFDQDRIPGSIDRNGLDARLYALKQMGFRGYFVLDIMPEETPIEKAVKGAIEEYRGSLARIERLDHQLIIDSLVRPDLHRGDLEIALARAANPSLSK